MLDQKSLIRVNYTRLVDKSRSSLIDVHVTAIGHFLEQLQQVDLTCCQTWVGVRVTDVLDYYLPP